MFFKKNLILDRGRSLFISLTCLFHKISVSITALSLWGLGLSFSLVFLVSCHFPFNESPAPSPEVKIKIGFDSHCLNNTKEVMRAFFAGTALSKDVENIWSCFGKSISFFKKKVVGEKQEEYAPNEVAQFIQEMFLDQNSKISPQLLTEFMIFKQLFVGGSKEKITFSELDKIVNFTEEMKKISLDILPHMKVITKRWLPDKKNQYLDAEVQTFENATAALQKASRSLSDIVEKNHQGYELDHFPLFLKELSKIYSQEWTFISELENLMPLLLRLKTSLTGGEEKFVASEEWRRFALLISRGYIQYLRYYYFSPQGEEEIKFTNLDFNYLTKTLDDLLSYFGEMLSGKPGGKFTEQELTDLCKVLKSLLPQLKISDNLLSQIMKIKQALVGGNAQEWLAEDFYKAREKVLKVLPKLDSIRKYWIVYNLHWKIEKMDSIESKDFFQKAMNALNDFLISLSFEMKGFYDLQNLIPLINELNHLYKTSNDLMNYFPLLIGVKNLILLDQHAVVSSNQWPLFISSIKDVFQQSLYYYYFLNNQNLLEGQALKDLSFFADDSLNLINKILEQRKSLGPFSSPFFSFNEIDLFIDKLESSKILPIGLFNSSLTKEAYRVALDPWLNPPERRMKGQKSIGLDQANIQYLRQEFKRWHRPQLFIDEIFSHESEYSLDSILALIDQHAEKENLSELIKALKTDSYPLLFEKHGLLIFKPKLLKLDRYSLNLTNISRQLVRFFIQSFSESQVNIDKLVGITKEEGNKAFLNSLKPLLIRMEIFDESENDFAKNRFYDANLFTSQANGDDYIGYKEGTDLILMIISGLRLNDLMDKYINLECSIHKAKKYYDNKVESSCLIKVYEKHYSEIMWGLPGMHRFLKKLPTELFFPTMKNMVIASGHDYTFSGNWIKNNDYSHLPHILQYIESLMLRFDTDGNGELNIGEALQAYPAFESIIKKITKNPDPNFNKAIFTYILKYGTPPSSFKDKMYFNYFWLGHEESWSTNTDRKLLASILAFIVDALKK